MGIWKKYNKKLQKNVGKTFFLDLFFKTPHRQIINLSKSPIVQMSNCQFVKTSKCQIVQMSIKKLKESHPSGDMTLVIRPRFERGTVCLEGRCSIQLSYRTLSKKIRLHCKVNKNFVRLQIILKVPFINFK